MHINCKNYVVQLDLYALYIDWIFSFRFIFFLLKEFMDYDKLSSVLLKNNVQSYSFCYFEVRAKKQIVQYEIMFAFNKHQP